MHDLTVTPPLHVMVPPNPGKHAHAAPAFVFELATRKHVRGLVIGTRLLDLNQYVHNLDR